MFRGPQGRNRPLRRLVQNRQFCRIGGNPVAFSGRNRKRRKPEKWRRGLPEVLQGLTIELFRVRYSVKIAESGEIRHFRGGGDHLYLLGFQNRNLSRETPKKGVFIFQRLEF